MVIADRIVVMKDGVIQQVGTPEEVYFNPRNAFVAGFIGSPQMNLGRVRVSEQSGDIYINLGGIKIKLPENKADRAGAYIGWDILAGIRPEHIWVCGPGDENPCFEIIDATVEVREFLGDRTYLYCKHGEIPLTVRPLTPDCKTKSGDKIKIGLQRDMIYLFDKDTENAIC